MKDLLIATSIVVGVVLFVALMVFGIPWLMVIANTNACNAYTWGGEGFHKEAAYTCRGVR